MHRRFRSVVIVAPLAVAAAALTGCGATESAAQTGERLVNVDSGAKTCGVSNTSAPAGALTFRVSNSGDAATEFYLYKADGTTVVDEVENIGPGTSRNMNATVEAGSYVTACKPGMTGDGIRGAFTVR